MEQSLFNNVKNRFLPLPRSSVAGLEHEPKKSDFDIIKELGIGSFGTVYLVSHKKTKAKYALKAIDKRVPENLEEKENFRREVEIMYKLNHPNIVKLYGHFEDEHFCYFLMQYIPNKSVYNLIPRYGKQPNIKLVASIMKDLLSAVYYLHNMKPTIIHRDIKPENVLIDENSRAYLTDFGWSNYSEGLVRRNTTCGTPLYLPPEMLTDDGHDETADIWCIGILLFELLVGDTPFEGNDLEAVALNICTLNISWPSYMDPDAKDLISKILKLNGKDRLPIIKIVGHKFFTKFFPNAVKELVKSNNNPKNEIFVVSVDDPKTFGKENKIIQNKTNIKASINKINISNNKNKNSISKNNKGAFLIKTKTMYAPRAKIDLSKSTKEKDKKNLINKVNNNKICTSNIFDVKSKMNNISSNGYYKNNYNNSFISTEYKHISPNKNKKNTPIASTTYCNNYTDNNYKVKNKINHNYHNYNTMNNDDKSKNYHKINNNNINKQKKNYNNNIYHSSKTLINDYQNFNSKIKNNRTSNSIKENNKSKSHLRDNTKQYSKSFIENTGQNTSKFSNNNYFVHKKINSNQNLMFYYSTNNNDHNDYNDNNQRKRKISINNNNTNINRKS